MDAALFAGKHSDRTAGERDATRQTFPGSEVDETFAIGLTNQPSFTELLSLSSFVWGNNRKRELFWAEEEKAQ